MPKHVRLAMTMRHITGSKQVINLLNHMGHCSSYEDAEVIDTSLAAEALAQKESDGVVIPTNITPGSFIQVAADNYLLENTLDSKHTTHSTTLVMYQQGHFGPNPQKVARADHTGRGRSLKITENHQQIQEFGAFGKKPQVKFLIDQINNDWYKPNQKLQEKAFELDLAWAVVRMFPTKFLSIDQGWLQGGGGGNPPPHTPQCC